MFIKQIKHIASVGRFRQCAAEGDVTFKKYTLIFGENGRGKTTLCSIMRSLQTNNPDIVVGRKTLGSSKDQNVVLTLENGSVLFKGGTWSSVQQHLRIFDSHYVADNVYFGDAIGTNQRRNLCSVILGSGGVALAAEYHNLDSAITDKSSDIRNARRLLTSHVAANQVDRSLYFLRTRRSVKKSERSERRLTGYETSVGFVRNNCLRKSIFHSSRSGCRTS